MRWKTPPTIKIYEALGALGDGRVEMNEDKTSAKVSSSSRNKYYDVSYDPEKHAITSNDNGSYWEKYLGYPSICLLMARGDIHYEAQWEKALKGFAWKDLNTTHKNDYEKVIDVIREEVAIRGYSLQDFDAMLKSVHEQIKDLQLSMLGKTGKSPSGY